MYQAIIVVHILLGLGIIGLIMMQQGKGADAGATFGGGASGSVFGAQGAASFLSRTTAIMATLFFITSLGLAWINGHRTQGTSNDIMSAPAEEKPSADIAVPNVESDKAPVTPAAPVAPAPAAVPNPTPTAQGATVTPKVETPPPAPVAPAQSLQPAQPEPVVEEPKAEVEQKAEDSAKQEQTAQPVEEKKAEEPVASKEEKPVHHKKGSGKRKKEH